MSEPDLDEYCKKIILVLTLMRKDYGFNELLHFLNEHGHKVSKPTLSTHLKKHLLRRRIVIHKKLGPHDVYSMNYAKFKKLNETSDITHDLVAKFYQQERSFRSLPIADKIEYLHSIAVLQSLMLLKLEILTISKPEKQFEYSMSQYNLLMHFGTIRNWLLDDLRKNPRELENATAVLEDLTNKYMKVLFEEKPETTQSNEKGRGLKPQE